MRYDGRKQHYQCKQDKQMHQNQYPDAHIRAKNVVEAGVILFSGHLRSLTQSY
jgi:hypothetical protein